MHFPTSTTTVLLAALIPSISAWAVDFYTDRECTWYNYSLDLPGNSGCRGVIGEAPWGLKYAAAPEGNCVVSFYSDESCNTYVAIISSENTPSKYDDRRVLSGWRCDMGMAMERWLMKCRYVLSGWKSHCSLFGRWVLELFGKLRRDILIESFW
ncbi:hypothetical protein M011DRAFT_97779 [Sporormia fimetaria CBS 119925]|uniref:Uncharacterized protein n=1 Tax=Sporormia fimetaria CBS 119925 TaxID=1340428 RepID=A0A6A6V8S2_9PLEO|nr:hypothetical protein M011DRAFT_97779 [Sporormia fimetaria CBS 119925]